MKHARSIARLAPVALMPAGAAAVHELRYLLAYGPHASTALAQQGHAYLHSLVPWLVLSLGLACGAFARAIGCAWSGERTAARYSLSLLGLWFLCTISLLGIYAAQETLEGVFATGHAAGLPAIFGFGGWWAIPASLCVGLVLAAAYHTARWVLATVAKRARRQGARAGAPPKVRFGGALAAPRLAPVANGWSGRGPPALRVPVFLR